MYREDKLRRKGYASLKGPKQKGRVLEKELAEVCREPHYLSCVRSLRLGPPSSGAAEPGARRAQLCCQSGQRETPSQFGEEFL